MRPWELLQSIGGNERQDLAGSSDFCGLEAAPRSGFGVERFLEHAQMSMAKWSALARVVGSDNNGCSLSG